MSSQVELTVVCEFCGERLPSGQCFRYGRALLTAPALEIRYPDGRFYAVPAGPRRWLCAFCVCHVRKREGIHPL